MIVFVTFVTFVTFVVSRRRVQLWCVRRLFDERPLSFHLFKLASCTERPLAWRRSSTSVKRFVNFSFALRSADSESIPSAPGEVGDREEQVPHLFLGAGDSL